MSLFLSLCIGEYFASIVLTLAAAPPAVRKPRNDGDASKVEKEANMRDAKGQEQRNADHPSESA